MSQSPDWKSVTAVIKEYSATFYYGSLLLGGEARKGAWAVYAACRIGDNAVDDSTQPHADLQAWWEGLERAYSGRPVANWEQALTWALERFDIPLEAFAHMRQGFETDLGTVRMESQAQLMEYCYQVAGTVGRMIAPLGGATSPQAELAAVRLGQAMQLTNCLRDVGEDLEMGRVYLPADWLAEYDISIEDLRQGQVTPEYVALLSRLAAEARRLYREGLTGLRYLRQGRAAVALAAFQYQGILDKLEQSGYNNLTQRAALRPHERLLLLPRAILASGRH